MYIIKNAFKCISRSWGRNILIGIIVLVISVSCCIGLSIRQAAQSAREETLSAMNITATISLDRKSMMDNMGDRSEGFDKNQFADMMNESSSLTLSDYEKYAQAASVKDFYYNMTVSFNETENFKAVSTESDSSDSNMPSGGGFGGGFMGGFGGGMKGNINSGDFSIIGYSSDSAMTDFISGNTSISDGKVFQEKTSAFDCIISDELATYNDITVGSSIKLSNPKSEDEIYTLNVVGIYSNSDSNSEFQKMPGSDPANEIYMSYSALDKIISESQKISTTQTDEDTGREYETGLVGNLSSTYVLADVDAYNSFTEEVRTLGLDDSFTVSSSDITAFENSLVPLNTLSTMAGWFLLVILIIGAIILIVLNIFNIRERKYEIGVLTAIGMKKINVALQFLTEVFAVTMAAVIIGICIGSVTAVPVTNALLQNQITSSQNRGAQLEQNFGRGEMPNMGNMGGFGGGENMPAPDRDFSGIENIFGEKAADYVSEINSAMNFTVVLQMFLIALLLTLVAGAVSMLFVMRYEPLKILANRD